MLSLFVLFCLSLFLAVLCAGHLRHAKRLPPEQDHLHVRHGASLLGCAFMEEQPGVPRRGQGAPFFFCEMFALLVLRLRHSSDDTLL